MTTLRLKHETILKFLGGATEFNGCKEIRSIFCREATPNKVTVEAQMPALSTPWSTYTTCIIVEKDGSTIHRASCSCPVGRMCKHIHKVLLRIANSQNNPLPGPSPQDLHREEERKRQLMQREEERKRKAAKMDHASVYIAIACKVEVDSGSDYNRSQYVKDNVDQEILGVFFSKRQANRCAKERAYQDEDMDSEEEEGDEDGDDSVDVDTFVNDPHDDWDDDMMYEKVWVERRTIEDASYDFHT